LQQRVRKNSGNGERKGRGQTCVDLADEVRAALLQLPVAERTQHINRGTMVKRN
jgi:hypothetical protein